MERLTRRQEEKRLNPSLSSGRTEAGIPSQGECTVDVKMHGWVSAHLQSARLTEFEMSSTPDGIVVSPPLLKKLGGLGVRHTRLGMWTSWEPPMGT